MRPEGRPAASRLITFVTDRPGHDFRYAIDATEDPRELGWAPSVTLDEGLRRTVAGISTTAWWWQAIQATRPPARTARPEAGGRLMRVAGLRRDRPGRPRAAAARHRRPGRRVRALARAEADLADPEACAARDRRSGAPTSSINAAAYTAVDRAEDEPEAARTRRSTPTRRGRWRAPLPRAACRSCTSPPTTSSTAAHRAAYARGRPDRPARRLWARASSPASAPCATPAADAVILRTSWVFSAARQELRPDHAAAGGRARRAARGRRPARRPDRGRRHRRSAARPSPAPAPQGGAAGASSTSAARR